ncbi:CaiB/BaiF CoA-transferase family protein [Granulosicoccaceae sp. 1_MG-2023]|nr:CaiB/BaiF CoA-transferase family protein [Granulosicoccaceae sp. 1_MG-2023]
MTENHSHTDEGMLEGVRVLDLSRVLAGPWASQMLADMGADVIKIERPGRGDDTRSWGPPWWEEGGQSAYFTSANRGKRSVAVDIASADGQAVIRKLVAQCDVLLENYKVGGLAKYGLDYPSLREINPGLVYCSITGFGQSGPYRQRAGYDFMIQAMGGLMSVTGEPDDKPGGGPQKVGVALTDVMTGLYAGNAILAALFARQRSGRGRHLDLALLDVQFAALANQAANYLCSGEVPGRMGNAHPNIVPYQAFAASDGWLIVAVGNDAQFARFAAVLGEPGWGQDPRFSENAARVANRDELIALIVPHLKKQSVAHWLDALNEVGVPCGPVNTIADVVADQQVQARALVVQRGDKRFVASPIREAGQAPLFAERPVPALGEHTDEVLGALAGLSESDIATLRDKGIVA